MSLGRMKDSCAGLRSDEERNKARLDVLGVCGRHL